MEKEQEKHEWFILFLILAVSLIISVVAIFQLLDKVADLEGIIIKQSSYISDLDKINAEQTKKLAELQGVGG